MFWCFIVVVRALSIAESYFTLYHCSSNDNVKITPDLQLQERILGLRISHFKALAQLKTCTSRVRLDSIELDGMVHSLSFTMYLHVLLLVWN